MIEQVADGSLAGAGVNRQRHRPDAADREVGEHVAALEVGEGGARRMIQIVFGLSIAFAASSFFLSFFSFGGGAML